jgi:hypothetical protein
VLGCGLIPLSAAACRDALLRSLLKGQLYEIFDLCFFFIKGTVSRDFRPLVFSPINPT